MWSERLKPEVKKSYDPTRRPSILKPYFTVISLQSEDNVTIYLLLLLISCIGLIDSKVTISNYLAIFTYNSNWFYNEFHRISEREKI